MHKRSKQNLTPLTNLKPSCYNKTEYYFLVDTLYYYFLVTPFITIAWCPVPDIIV